MPRIFNAIRQRLLKEKRIAMLMEMVDQEFEARL